MSARELQLHINDRAWNALERARVHCEGLLQKVSQVVDSYLAEHQFAIMRGDALNRIAAIDGAAAAAVFAPLLVAGGAGKHDAARVEAERNQQAKPELMGRPDIENAGNTDAQLSARP